MNGNRSVYVGDAAGVRSARIEAGEPRRDARLRSTARHTAGNTFALTATRDQESARAAQQRIANKVEVADFVPELRDLPEGLGRDVFQSEYGGLGGKKAQAIVDDIVSRLDGCAALR